MTLQYCICRGQLPAAEMTRQQKDTYHPPGGEIRALLELLAVLQKAVQCPDAIGNQVVGFEEVKILGKVLDVVAGIMLGCVLTSW